MLHLSDTASKSCGVAICNVDLMQYIVDLYTFMTPGFEHPTKYNSSGSTFGHDCLFPEISRFTGHRTPCLVAHECTKR